MALMHRVENITRATFLFWTMNASCYQEGRGGGGDRILEYCAPYGNMSHYQPLRIFRN